MAHRLAPEAESDLDELWYYGEDVLIQRVVRGSRDLEALVRE
jgi:hypothetical protein